VPKVPFRFRKIPPYVFDGDGQFPEARIIRKNKKRFKKKQIKKYLEEYEKE
jgi:hypothetical protein